MNIQYISDLHLEFLNISKIDKIIKKITANAPILVLAGDIGNPFKNHYRYFLSKMSLIFNIIIVIAGNHEYYHNNILDVKSMCAKICDEFDNVKFLDNNIFEYNNYVFIGTTLWSHIINHNNEINDISCINDITIYKYNTLHKESLDFIINALDNTDKQAIVITHHLPSYDLIDNKYKTNEYIAIHQWFASDMNIYFSKYQVKICAWIYGHTHSSNICNIDGINFYCNPIGYNGENHDINYNAIITC